MKNYIVVQPRDSEHTIEERDKLFEFFDKYDVHKWIIGAETGKNGYNHWQMRMATRFTFDQMKVIFPKAHIEECSDTWEYERKEGDFWTSEDTPEIRAIRFGEMNDRQKHIVETARSQNDRQVDVWYDPKGNNGKTWLTVHLWERGKALVVPRASCTAEKLSAFICSAYRGQEFIIIDIPRAGKIPAGLYECIEEVKDGLVFDHRYAGKARNIRGAKVIVFTNTKLDEKRLSFDRWRLHGIHEGEGRGEGSSFS